MIWKGWDLVLVTPWNLPVLAVCVTLGMLAHLAGDMCTHDGLSCPWSPFPPGARGYPGRAGGLWLCRTLVLSGFQAVVVPSGFRTRVHPHR